MSAYLKISMTMCLAAGVMTSAVATRTASAADPVTVTKVSSPEKALKFEVVVPASVDDVWTAFTTKDGLSTWLWRDTSVDLRPGGDWLAIFPGSTAGGTITSITPKRELVIAAMAPDKFPTVRKKRTTATFSFHAITPTSTQVTLMQTGWKAGPEWDAAYDYLASGNADLLGQLYTRFAKGPIAWPK